MGEYWECKFLENEKQKHNLNLDEERDMQTSNNLILSYRQQNWARNRSTEIWDRGEQEKMILFNISEPNTPITTQEIQKMTQHEEWMINLNICHW